MKILINCSNLTVGGGVQVALSFLNEIVRRSPGHEFILLSSYEVYKQLNINVKESISIYTWHQKKYFNIFLRYRWLTEHEENIKPDVVFSVFGPSYWRPKAPHAEGFAAVWLLYPKSEAYDLLSKKQYLHKKIQNHIKKILFKYESRCLIVETDEAKQRLKYVLNNSSSIHVVGNTFSHHFINTNKSCITLPKRVQGEYRFVTITNNYIHKNLNILNDVIPLLRKNNVKVKFYLTISDKDYQKTFSKVKDYVCNIGPVDQECCPSVYRQVDALFLPTLLEVYSASYPEAMISGLPILTSDLGFAHDICQNAALYFNPMSPDDIYKKIVCLIEQPTLHNELIENGYKRIKSLNTSENRAIQYLSILENLREDNLC